MAAFERFTEGLSYQDLIKWVRRWLVRLVFGSIIVSLGVWGLGEIQFERPFLECAANLLKWIEDFAQNFGTEMAGALVTFWLLDQILGERQQQIEAEERLRQAQASFRTQLRQATHSREDRQAILDEMRDRYLLRGANLRFLMLDWAQLQWADLNQVKLREASLQTADLSQAELEKADLQGVNFKGAHLTGTVLVNANLRGTILYNADLSHALLMGVDLIGAILSHADLRGADFRGAILRYADLEEAILDETTRLPDGNYWSPDVDMERFTEPKHPDFYGARPSPQQDSIYDDSLSDDSQGEAD